MKDSRNTIARQKAVRSEALRQKLAAGGHVQHILDMVDKVTDEDKELEPIMVQRLKIGIDTKLALIKKYIPDLKQVEKVKGDSLEGLTEEELDAAIEELQQRA